MSGTLHIPDSLSGDYSDVELEAARRLKLLGLNWSPQTGDHVYDFQGKVDIAQPPIRRVYQLSDDQDDVLMGKYGGREGLVKEAIWLPTIQQA
jgi:hypothetical protein